MAHSEQKINDMFLWWFQDPKFEAEYGRPVPQLSYERKRVLSFFYDHGESRLPNIVEIEYLYDNYSEKYANYRELQDSKEWNSGGAWERTQQYMEAQRRKRL